MSSTENLSLLVEALESEQRLVAAKEAFDGVHPEDDAYDEKHAEYREAKDAVRAHRAFWRGIREFIAAAPADGDAAANPETHGMGISPQEG